MGVFLNFEHINFFFQNIKHLLYVSYSKFFYSRCWNFRTSSNTHHTFQNILL